MLTKSNPVYLGGKLRGLEPPRHYDFRHLRVTPRETRTHFEKLGWQRVVAFQTRNPMHRAHLELTFRAAQIAEANLLIHPSRRHDQAGRHRPLHARALLRAADLRTIPSRRRCFSLLPLAMRMGGPREALWHAIIRKNYGCTHFIVGRDHAGPGNGADGKPFYGPYDAQELVQKHRGRTRHHDGAVPGDGLRRRSARSTCRPTKCRAAKPCSNISGTELRRRLHEGLDIPDWFTYPEVIEELRRTHPPRHKQGCTIFFTGLVGLRKVDARQRAAACACSNSARAR